MEISGHNYRFGKMNAMKQWNVLRRIAPAIVGVLGMANIKAAIGEDDDAEIDVRELIDRIEPFLDALSKLSDEDNKYVIDACLGVVGREVSGDRGWQMIGSSDALMFDDIDLAVILRLTFEAGKENLLGFFDAFRRMYPASLESLSNL